jgi:hypothetical protein
VTGESAVVFNPAAVHPNTVANYTGNYSNVTSYVVQGEFVSWGEKKAGVAPTAGTTVTLSQQSNDVTGLKNHQMDSVHAGLKDLRTYAEWAMLLRKK